MRREGIELSAGFTAATNAVMRVGGVEETITVTGASPIVDTQNVRTQNVLSQQVLDTVPTAKALPGLAALTLGDDWRRAGCRREPGRNPDRRFRSMAVCGNDQRIKYDGMSMNSFHTLRGRTEPSDASQSGGHRRNGARDRAVLRRKARQAACKSTRCLATAATVSHLCSWRLHQQSPPEQQHHAGLQRGVSTPPKIQKIYDWGIGVGGPIKRDKLWFYTPNRWWGTEQLLPNAYCNAQPGTPFYMPRSQSSGDLARTSWRTTAFG